MNMPGLSLMLRQDTESVASTHCLTDDALIEYCYTHCRTPRALFHESHINRLLELAGKGDLCAGREWASYGPDMIYPLVFFAKGNQKKKEERAKAKEKPAPWQEVGF